MRCPHGPRCHAIGAPEPRCVMHGRDPNHAHTHGYPHRRRTTTARLTTTCPRSTPPRMARKQARRPRPRLLQRPGRRPMSAGAAVQSVVQRLRRAAQRQTTRRRSQHPPAHELPPVRCVCACVGVVRVTAATRLSDLGLRRFGRRPCRCLRAAGRRLVVRPVSAAHTRCAGAERGKAHARRANAHVLHGAGERDVAVAVGCVGCGVPFVGTCLAPWP